MAPATDAHVLVERDLGGHLQCEFDFRAFTEGHVGEQKGSARTKVLGEAESFRAGRNVTQGNWEVKSEALSNAAFNNNRRIRHGRSTSFGNRREKATATATVAQSGASGKSKICAIPYIAPSHCPQPPTSVETGIGPPRHPSSYR